MICFRGVSFCWESYQCANTNCTRHFGDDDMAAAVKWWGGENPPVQFIDYRTASCGYVLKDAAEKARRGEPA